MVKLICRCALELTRHDERSICRQQDVSRLCHGKGISLTETCTATAMNTAPHLLAAPSDTFTICQHKLYMGHSDGLVVCYNKLTDDIAGKCVK